ncbi:MAG TPA: serine/threonine-protein kinase [Pyrinomonadaceae bacterium]|nr:serine/threonine-protein kinase [Pyrinomonadaceae bacterium]
MQPNLRCPLCGKEISNLASSCQNCGASLEDAETFRFEPAKPTAAVSYDSIDQARFVTGKILAERYRIVGLIGKGGMGEVYRADDLKLGQPVALKFLPETLLRDGAALARFHREVRVARQVSHRNVCRVYDIGEVNGDHFLSMEFIKGEELSSLLRRIGRLPSDKAVQIARQICAGLAAAHEAGVLHRDLKPSNVMIDGDGNARILDFGLAGLSEEFRDEEISSGTPAYMAPEQLDGSAVTVRSDIYSLGVVLYELFTGKRAFEASSLNDLIRLRRSDTTPTTPTAIVKDLDPIIESVIDRCMQKDATKRPASALQVAAALPGGDPIAAALAAGETPSPEMVAAAPKKGTLRPAVALSLLAALIVFLAVPMALSRHLALHRIIPFRKSPEVLKEQASQLARALGYAAPADSAYTFQPDYDYYSYLAEPNTQLNSWEVLRHPQPPLLRFWYRQSTSSLLPLSTQYVNMWDPPNVVPGMVRISLDTEGQLSYLDAVPEQVSNSGSQTSSESSNQNAAENGTSKFADLFRAAGLDINQFQPVESQWTPPHAYDSRQAWTGAYPNLPQVPIRIEAAGYHGRPVYFDIVTPWRKPFSELSDSQSTGQKIGTWILLGLFFGTMIVAALLALRNLRAGRGDRKGAFRVALFLFILRMVHWLVSTHHVAAAEELVLLTTGLQSALFWSCFVGLLYLALEPYLRRRWPQRIISWNRLLAGEFRDPLVGRDILVGAVFGACAVLLMFCRTLLPKLIGANPSLPDVNDGYATTLVGIGAFMGMLAAQISASMVQAFVVVFLILFLSLLLRKDWIGITLGFLILSALFTSIAIGKDHITGLLFIPLTNVLFVLCAVRFGPLALMNCLTVFHLWVFFPITTEFSAWYATVFVMDLIFLLALAGYGFFTSLGGQSPFKIRLLAED